MKVSRNAPCPCGSGDKHKRCCLDKLPDVDVLCAIAFGTDGPDHGRTEALSQLQELGELAAGSTVSIWQAGAWREQFLYEITPDAVDLIPEGELRDVMGQALEAMHQNDLVAAERLNRWLCDQMPDEAAPRNNLASALIAQGRRAEGEEILVGLLATHPDYLPARTALVQLCLASNELIRARILLAKLRMPARVHPALYARFLIAAVRVELKSAMPSWDAADRMLDTVEELDPDDDDLGMLRIAVGMGRLARGGRLRGKRRSRSTLLPGAQLLDQVR